FRDTPQAHPCRLCSRVRPREGLEKTSRHARPRRIHRQQFRSSRHESVFAGSYFQERKKHGRFFRSPTWMYSRAVLKVTSSERRCVKDSSELLMNEVLFHFLGAGVTPWKVIGYLGTGLFAGRWFVQLYASRVSRKPVLPTLFWYMSIVGSFLLLS